ncbi:MAG: alpha-E domain-containing protein [Verrucomicrobium sp.]|nr:alpha-E domain-containing protein [Verrucomicrobium sp.]
MLSRVADNIYWMARYLERAEHTARLLGIHLNLILDLPTESEAERTGRLFEGLGIARPPEVPPQSVPVTHYLALEPTLPGSVFSCVAAARRNARGLRDHISSEMWGQLNRLYLRLGESEASERVHYDPQGLLREAVDGISLFHGLSASTLHRGECWQFIELGLCLERALEVTALLSTHFRHLSKSPSGRLRDEALAGADFMEWAGLLRACGAFEAYCNRHTADFRPARIAEFLLLDGGFPKAVRFAAERVEECLVRIADLSQCPPDPELHRMAGKLASLLRYGKIEEILNVRGGGVPVTLDSIRAQCARLHEAVYRSFIHYAVDQAIPA